MSPKGRSSALPQARYIKPETICIGDTIRVTHRHKDVTKDVVGTVASRNVFNHSTEYVTHAGVVLYTYWRYATEKGYTITLLNRTADSRPAMLAGMENV